MTWAMSPAPITPTRTRGTVPSVVESFSAGRVDTWGSRPPSRAAGRRGLDDRATVAFGCNDTTRGERGRVVKLALVTEGMIHRSLDDLMDWLDQHVPAL